MPQVYGILRKNIVGVKVCLLHNTAVVTESKLVKERDSKTEREIDIAIESALGQHSVMIAIECRDHGRPADINWIDSIIGKYRDLPVDKVVAVSRSGFTRGAVEKAMDVKILTVTLEEAIDAKLIPSTQQRILPVDIRNPGPPEIDVIFKRADYERYGEYTGDIKRGELQSPVDKYNGILIDVLRSEVLRARIEETKNNPTEFEEGPMKPITLSFPEGTRVISDSGAAYGLREVTIRQSTKIETIRLVLNSFRYMGVELLVGDIIADGVKAHVLLLYKDGEDQYQYHVRMEGDILSMQLDFSIES